MEIKNTISKMIVRPITDDGCVGSNEVLLHAWTNDKKNERIAMWLERLTIALAHNMTDWRPYR